MNKEPQDIKSIFAEALEKKTAKERAAYLDKACGNDANLRSKVEALLKSHCEAGDFLEVPAFEGKVTLDNYPATKGTGATIGRYRLLQQIGEGGMGLVYLAEQQEPVRRRVALKIVKPGMDSKQVIARFEMERQALALLDHPNIAYVFDAGTTETGRPYFVMEYVKGLSLIEYCDREKLSIEERLELFLQVCEAIQHAHQKGIIHRDIKPSNVLVSKEGEKALPKIIDFGVAKALTQPLTERTLFTVQGQLIGTPEYMSPEQVDMAIQDIDIRSDIYSLGVLLYELLAGTLPFERKELEEVGLAEIQRIIREEEPPRPSTRLSSLGQDAESIAESRRTKVAMLAKRLHKELEWIPLKAMRKERARRYRTASELADDVQNYLDGTPLIAGPESAVYRIKKFVRRNRAWVASIAAVLVVLIAGIVVSTFFAVVAVRQARILEAAFNFLWNDILASVDPEKTQKRPEEIEVDPDVEASMRTILAMTYQSIGAYKEAERHLERALEVCPEEVDEDVLGFMRCLAMIRVEQNRLDEAETLLVKLLEIERRVLGDEHPKTLNYMEVLALLYKDQGRYDKAKPLLVKVLEGRRRVLGEEHRKTLGCMHNLGLVYLDQGRYDEAPQLFSKALEIGRRVLREEDPWLLNFMSGLSRLYIVQDRWEEAEPLFVETLEIQRRVLGEEHPDTLGSMNKVAVLCLKQRRYEEAEPLYIELLEIQRRVLGEEHADTLESMKMLEVLKTIKQWLYQKGELLPLIDKAVEDKQLPYDEWETLLVKLLEFDRDVLGEEHPDTVGTIKRLIKFYESCGKAEKAEEWRAKLPRKETTEDNRKGDANGR